MLRIRIKSFEEIKMVAFLSIALSLSENLTIKIGNGISGIFHFPQKSANSTFLKNPVYSLGISLNFLVPY
jgi:hypothetical protein